jgi:hypothetical protein
MSERGGLLLANDQQREDCLRQARRVWGELLAIGSVASETDLAELDIARLRRCIEALAELRERMRELQIERRELVHGKHA